MKSTLALFVGLSALVGCGTQPTLYGDAVSFEALRGEAVTLEAARLMDGPVTVIGSVGRVCDVGCWFYLMDDAGMVYVKLDLDAGLVIPSDSEGKQALATGEFEGEGSSAEFRASAVVLY